MRFLRIFVLSTIFVSPWLLLSHHVCADVNPGEVLDKTNWQKAQGILPDQVLNWVKKGDFIIHVEELSYNPADFFLPFYLESRETNIGKYELSAQNEIIETKTGRSPEMILGIPFPKIDPNDPKAAVKIMYNKCYAELAMGSRRFSLNIAWIGRGGFEREVEATFTEINMTGSPDAVGTPNPERFERLNIISVRKPYDLAGTSQMLWRYLSSSQDVNFAYVPAIRRVRRLTPANRSDAFLGSDGAVDDILLYLGKVPHLEWKLLRRQTVLAPFQSKDPIRMIRNQNGEWEMSTDLPATRIGFQDRNWTGAPWCPIDLVYVKRPAYVIEAIPKDPYYNYGAQTFYIDAETMGGLYKVIYDRNGSYWKAGFIGTMGFQSPDKKSQILGWTDHVVVDEKRDHSTYIRIFDPRTKLVFYAKLDPNDFTLAGFQKYCK
jgi:hypothetical protein